MPILAMTSTVWKEVLLLIIVCFISPSLSDSGLKGPPHISGNIVEKYKGTLGDSVKIDCPIDSDLPPLYEWSKDGEAITVGWDRFRVNGKKLRIRGLMPEDRGKYKCRAINGFGKLEVSTRLLLYDENGAIVGDEGEDDYETSDETKHDSEGDLGGMIPKIVEMSKPTSGQTFKQTVGSSLTLVCKVEGEAFVSWIKDGVQLPKLSGLQQIELTDLSTQDSGTYLCNAWSEIGQANATFVVEVYDIGMIGGPIITLLEPSNLTVEQGTVIKLRCHIQSESQPRIQWIYERDDIGASQQQQSNTDRALKENAWHGMTSKFKVISTTNPVLALQNGSYVSELKLKTESQESSGAYICLATNNKGYNFLKGFVHILPPKISGSLSPSLNLTEGEVPSSDSFGILLAIPSTLVVLFAALVCFCVRRCQHKSQIRHRNGGCGPDGNVVITTAANYANPVDVIQNNHNNLRFGMGHPHHGHGHPNGHGHMNSSLPFCKTTRHQIAHPHPQVSHPGSQIITDGRRSMIPSNFGNHFYCKEPSNAAAYASVPIHTNSTFGRAPPLPSFPPCDRTNFNNQGLLTPLLTQTASSNGSDASSSDKKNSRNHQIRL